MTTAGAKLAGYFAPQITREVATLRSAVEQSNYQLGESIAALQAATREDIGWQLMSGVDYDQIFTIDFIREAIRVARVMFLQNPLICRAVMLQAFYVFGRGMQVRVEDETANGIVQDFLKLNKKRLGIPGLTEMEKDVQNAGNLYIVAFRNEITGDVSVRTIDALQIGDIVCNPEDADEPWFYKRTWTQQERDPATGITNPVPKVSWYPAISYTPEGGMPIYYAGEPVAQNAAVLHRKVGSPTNSPYGYPETYPAFRWATAYKEFLTAWLNKEQSLARLALSIKTPGGQKAYDAQQTALQSRLSTGTRETNPAPTAGAAFIGGENTTVAAIKTQGSNTAPEEARRAFLMAIMLFGTESMFGDSKSGSFFTSKTLDRPTELKFLHAQERWKQDISDLCTYVLLVKSKAAGSGLKLQKTTEVPNVLVSFPPILEHDIAAQVQALVDAATLKGQSLAGTIDMRSLSSNLLHILGFEKVDDIVTAMYPDPYDPIDWAAATPAEKQELAAQLADKAAAVAQQSPNTPNNEAATTLSAMVRKLVEAMPVAPVSK